MAKKCILFVRVSTERQSFSEQEQELFNMAIRDGYKEKDIIPISEKESGRKLSEDERRGITRMKELIESDSSIDCVYAWEISRIARRKKVNFSVLDYLEERKIQLKVLNPLIVLFNQDGSINDGAEMVFTLFTQLAESEMRVKFERFARGKKENREKGRYNGGAIKYGYTIDKNGYFIINEEEAALIRRIYNMYLNENYSASTISSKLSEIGIDLSKRMIQKILADETYTGKGKTRQFPIIIDRELFDKTREIAKTKDSSADKSTKYYFGSKLLVCPDCGSFLTAYKNNGSYGCAKRHTDIKKCKNTSTIGINVIDTILAIKAKEKYSIYAIKEAKVTNERLSKENVELQQRIDVIEIKIQKIEKEYDKIGVLYRKGIIRNEEELDNAINEVKIKEKDLNNQKAQLINQINSNNEFITNFSNSTINYDELFRNAWNTKDTLSFKDCYEFIHSMIDKVFVTNDIDDSEKIKVINFQYKDGTKEKVCFYSNKSRGKQKIFGEWDENEKCWIETDYTDQWIKRV